MLVFLTDDSVRPDESPVLFVLSVTSTVSYCSHRMSKSFSDTSSSSSESLSLSVVKLYSRLFLILSLGRSDGGSPESRFFLTHHSLSSELLTSLLTYFLTKLLSSVTCPNFLFYTLVCWWDTFSSVFGKTKKNFQISSVGQGVMVDIQRTTTTCIEYFATNISWVPRLGEPLCFQRLFLWNVLTVPRLFQTDPFVLFKIHFRFFGGRCSGWQQRNNLLSKKHRQVSVFGHLCGLRNTVSHMVGLV